MIIDFHTHVLPGIDDGSPDIDMTEAMLREEKKQGVDRVVATPHFYADRDSMGRFIGKRNAACEKVLKRAEELETGVFPALSLGAEIYYFPGMGTADQLPMLAIDGGSTILLEMPFMQWTEAVFRDVQAIIEKQKLHIVLAHVERYIAFQKDMRVWEKVMELPLIPQINTGSFMRHKSGLFRKDKRRSFAMNFLKEHPGIILGSDCHNVTGRSPNMAEGRKAIEEELGADALKIIDRITEEVLHDRFEV